MRTTIVIISLIRIKARKKRKKISKNKKKREIQAKRTIYGKISFVIG